MIEARTSKGQTLEIRIGDGAFVRRSTLLGRLDGEEIGDLLLQRTGEPIVRAATRGGIEARLTEEQRIALLAEIAPVAPPAVAPSDGVPQRLVPAGPACEICGRGEATNYSQSGKRICDACYAKAR